MYLQTGGTAMGTRMAPSYAIIFMDNLEKNLLTKSPIKPTVSKRYIDDIFAILPEDPDPFVKWLNEQHPSIKFTMERYTEGLAFLDTWITKTENELMTTVYTKPTDTKQYLTPSSCHPPHTFRSIPYSQALRLQRICTNKEDLKEELHILETNLKKRGYKEELVKKSIAKIHEKKPPSEKKTPTTLILQYHPRNPQYQAIIQDVWDRHSTNLPAEITKPIVAFRRPRNLREMLTKALYGKTVWSQETKKYNLRPISTYNAAQRNIPHKQFLLACPSRHTMISEDYNSLQDILEDAHNDSKNPSIRTFFNTHKKCGYITAIPVQITHQLNIKCTECHYHYRYRCSKPLLRITKEIYHSNDCWSKGNLKRDNPGRRCTSRKCNTCPNANLQGFVKDQNQGIWYGAFDCKAENLIYCITCNQCNKHYIGLTTGSLNRRISQHRNSIKKNITTGIAEHGRLHGWDVTISILDQNSNWTTEDLQIREAIWIAMLRTVTHGLNKKDEYHKHISTHTLYTVQHFNHSRTCLPYVTSNVLNVTQIDLR